MQPSIPGYRIIQELHRSSRSLVVRAVGEADQRTVVLKTLNQEYPEPQELARLRREHQLLSQLTMPGVVRAYGLEPWNNNLALVMEDADAPPLAAQAVPMPLESFFALAISCARVLGRLHQHVIHKALHPNNILWSPHSGEVRLVDFGFASEVAAERRLADEPQRPFDSLAFVSPEQTGRMNREVDERTDFYSLGVTFYWLLTGQLPFTASDAMEWFYCHITQLAVPPEQRNPAVPPLLGAIVLKLMAKDPEDRYQSAHGLLCDLLECRQRWQETGTVAPFELARQDISARFQVPQRLYGRQAESQAVLRAFQAAATGHPTLVVVGGPAGIGKSTLVHDVRKAIVDRNGCFFEGKFDQFQRLGPYAAVAQALRGLVRHVLAEPEEHLAGWRARLGRALGPNGRIAVDLVPELAQVIGPCAAVAELPPTEAQNRFLGTIQSLITVFARPEQPLVLFFDDLQWSDAATLGLMRRLLESNEGAALLLIGAYRDDEVDAAHPLAIALAEMNEARPIEQLVLGPLSEDTLNRVVADTLHADPEQTRSLSAIIRRKTEGNPFFMGELLRTLHQDGMVVFDHSGGRWTWDADGVGRAQISDDVVHFMVSRIQRLAPETQHLLRQAACIGDAFELRLLAELVDQPLAAVADALKPAIGAGLITPSSAEPGSGASLEAEAHCRFLHDRVRQAAYALNPAHERPEIHGRIGRLLLALTPETERTARATEIAQQLNEGRARLKDEAERLELLRLNLDAGRAAKASAAYRMALDLTTVARELLPADAWTRHYALAHETIKLHASCAFLGGALEVAEACYGELLQHMRTPLEKADVLAMRAAHYAFADRMPDAVDEGLRALALLGYKLSSRPGMHVVLGKLLRCKLALGRRQASDLDTAPLLADHTVRLAMKILEGFLVPAYLTGNDTLFAATVLQQVTLSLAHGNCEESVSAYSGYAVLLAGMGDLEGAYAFGQLALRLSERFGVVDSKCRTLVLYGLFSHSWSQPWSGLEGWFKASVEAGLQSGDFLFMAYAAGYVHLWDPRIDLASALEQGCHYMTLCERAGHQNALDAAQCAQQFWRALRGETDGPFSLSDANFDEAACLARMEKVRYVSGIAIHHLFKLQLACFDGAPELAWQALQDADTVIKALAGSPYMVDYCVYGFQAAARIAGTPGAASRQAWRRLRKFHRRMRAWARHCPANFAHHERLMEAEIARLHGWHEQAPRRYEAAAATARASGFVRDEARANELAGRYYQSVGLNRVASAYWRDAYEGYQRWGALSKVRALKALLAEAAPAAAPLPVAASELSQVHLGRVPQLVASGMLDLSTVWKATQALSSEASVERLLEKLMAIVKESAGAQKAVLVLKEADATRFLVQAESLETGELRVRQGVPLDQHAALPLSVIRYALRAQTSVLLNDAASEEAYAGDPYIQAARPASVLAMPIVHQGHMLGVLYLENKLLSDAFTPERLAVLQIVAGQAAISLQNVRAAERAAYLEAERVMKDTYARTLEVSVEERTAELTKAYEQLKELDRLKTDFLSVVSHELRTPLTTIQGYSEFLEDGTGGRLSADQEAFVHQIQEGTTQLRRLVDDLLDFARVEAGSFKLVRARIDLVRALDDALDSLTPQLQERGQSLARQLPEAPVWVLADRQRLQQVITNLVRNAIKFTPADGRITVSLHPAEGAWRIEVTDTGIGIAPSHLPKLFQRFYQVDSSTTREQGGVGLGLSIAQSIVEAHGGSIGVESPGQGQGSTFWFTVPPAPEA